MAGSSCPSVILKDFSKVLILFLIVGNIADAFRTYVAPIVTTKPSPEKTDLCDSEVYCKGDLLKTVQLARLFNDSKTFVDHYQLNDPNVTIANFKKLMAETGGNPTRGQLEQYVKANFAQENELVDWNLPDWQEDPEILDHIEDEEFRQWAKDLNDLWKSLARKIGPDTIANPQRHSLIPVDNGFIVPGGRFQEFYYWDSYWVIEGLLLSGMRSTPRGMIENFLSMVERFGFIPNGGRVYYLMRSQPPLLIPMVSLYYEYTGNTTFLEEHLSTLVDEFDYFMRIKTVSVSKNGQTYRMARYFVDSDGPRPESYREDYELAQNLPPDTDSKDFYDDMKAAAESGWDFSSRWFISRDGGVGNLSQIETRNIIPVDLNAIMQRNARILADFHEIVGRHWAIRYYNKIADEFQRGIDDVLWNEEEGTWLDYDMKNSLHRNNFYPSNLCPLYTNSFDPAKSEMYADRIVDYLLRNKIDDYVGGTPTSLLETHEQWDFPNAWAPLQSFMVQGLRNTGAESAIRLAEKLAIRWLRANYIGYKETGAMAEKYNALIPGESGGGGEYQVQEGFGFTNGVVLEFLNIYPDATPADNPMDVADKYRR